MAIPKKGSRLITVNGDRYRWRFRHKPSYSQQCEWTNLTIAVEKADNPGTKLVVKMSQKYHSNYDDREVVAVLPSDVKICIEKALVLGWQPSTPGTPFEFTYFPSPSLV